MSAAPKSYVAAFYTALMDRYAALLMFELAKPDVSPKDKALLIVCFGELIKADSAGLSVFVADPD